MRLVNTQYASWGGINPHDKILLQGNATAKWLPGDILHYTYYTLEELAAQTNKFTTIQAQAMFAQGKKAGLIKLYVNPLLAFITGYIIKRGFLDGRDGFIIARSVAYSTMLKYAKLMHLWRNAAKK